MPTALYADDGTFLRFDGTATVRVIAADSVTRHPTERGVTITDHVQREPLSVSIVATVTESPLQEQSEVSGATAGLTGEARPRAAMDWLNSHRGQRLTLVSDGYDDLDDLVLVRVPNEVTASRQRILSLELTQILVASVEYVAIPPELPPAATAHAFADAADLGEQGTISGTDDTAQQARDVSAASLLLTYIGGG
jgi:hypothetical protein